MSRSVDGVKWRQWRERLRRFERGGGTVAAFCRAERVSVPAFYQWRRKLAGGPEGGRSPRAELGRGARADVAPGFVPVRIVPAASVEIRLPNGACVAVPGGEAATLATVLAVVGGLRPAGRAEHEEGESC